MGTRKDKWGVVEMGAGRPLKFETVEALKKLIDKYFASCEENEEPVTITGLAVALDTTRETLLDYEDKEEYSDTIKRAKAKIEAWTEGQLFRLKNPAGAIFNLTNNYRRWSNKQQQEISGPNGSPIQTQTVDFDPSTLSDDELGKVKEALEIMKGKKNVPK